MTRFFRNPRLTEALQQVVLPELTGQRRQATVRHVWVDGCFTGEAAYSLAILVVEHLCAAAGETSGAGGARVRILGTDASPRAIEVARRGWYSKGIEADVSASRLATYFRSTGDGYEIVPALAQYCSHLVWSEPSAPPASAVDLIVSLAMPYLTDDAKQHRLCAYREALRSGQGRLVLGLECGATRLDGFEQAHLAHPVYRATAAEAPVAPVAYSVASRAKPSAVRDAWPPLPRGMERRLGTRRSADSGTFFRPPPIEFRHVMRDASVAIVMVDGSDRIVFANTMAGRIFGFEAEELVGLSPDVLVPPALREDYAQQRRELLARTGATLPELTTYIGQHRNGEEVPVEIQMGTVGPPDHPMLVAFLTDTTERRRVEQQLRRYQAKLRDASFDGLLREARERRRLAENLHDRLGQSLALTKLRLEALCAGLDGSQRADAEQAVALLAEAIAETHDLTSDLSPPMLYDLGLVDALAWLAEDLQARHGLHVNLIDDDPAQGLDDETAAVLFRSVREALFNVLKHSGAKEARVTIRERMGTLRIDVIDQGVGFDAAEFGAHVSRGFGLFSVRERVERLGGEVRVASTPGQGTRVTMLVPVSRKRGAEGNIA